MARWKKIITAGHRLPLFMDLLLEGISLDLRKEFGCGHMEILLVSEHGVINWYVTEEDIGKFNNFLEQQVKENHLFASKIIERTIKGYEELIIFCEKIKRINLTEIKKEELISLFKTYCSKYKRAVTTYSIPGFMGKVVSKLLVSKLKRSGLKEEEIQEYAATLAMPIKQSEYKHEHENFLKIIQMIKEHPELIKSFGKDIEDVKDNLIRFYPRIDKELDDHVEKYSFTQVFHTYNPPTKEYYLNQIKNEIDKDVDEKINRIKNYVIEIQKQKQEILSQLKIDKELGRYVNYLEELAYINDYRKLNHSKSHYLSHGLLKELAKRLGISHIELKHLRCEEIIQALEKGKVEQKLIKKRMEFNVIYSTKHFLEGEEAKKFVSQILPKEKEEIKEFKGEVASRGKVRGRVKKVIKEYEINKVEKGDILVSSMTNPDMVLAMERAGAIVTDEGGMLCHAAIVSRELGVPCVVGTEIATRVLNDGDLVEVDAEEGKIIILSKNLIRGKENEN